MSKTADVNPHALVILRIPSASRRAALLTCGVLLSVRLFAQQPSPPAPTPATAPNASANDSATKLVQTTRLFLAGHSSRPGVTVELREYSRSQEQGQSVVRYHAFVHGAVPGHTYTALSWPINAGSPSELMSGITLGRDGIVECAGRAANQCGSPDKPDDPVNFAFASAKAEPARIALVSDDQSTTVMFGVVPDPLLKTDHGCTLEAIRLMPKWELVMIRARGFRPNEPIHFSSKSYNEKHDSDAKADSAGEYSSTILPFVAGKSSGKTDIRITSPTCSPSLSFEWGKL